VHRANVFQGVFPDHDTGADGWAGTCPVDAYEPNAWGLWNMVGNVWEWTADRFSRSGGCCAGGGSDDESTGVVLKGGSYLCHHSYCHRYRPGARTGSSPDSTSGNTGFRCVADR
jgi:formylglycine-generating enzyme required for sulfatase activity